MHDTTPPSEPTPTPEPKTDLVREAASTIRTVIIVLVLAVLLRLFVFEPFVVEGRSMQPRFVEQDYLLVDKVSYRFHQPERGDIIVFRYPNDPSLSYVKRVIGLPGDRVVITDGTVIIFNNEHPDGVQLDESGYLATSVTTDLIGTTQNSFTVSENYLFVMGDNRAASSDSREWGLLPQANVIGRVMVSAWPLNRLSIASHARYPGL
jgi:signal peptidase I